MENSKIEWTHHTFNPWIGCSKVSPGCANCYAETMMDKRWGKVQWGPQGKRVRTSDANWRKPLAWNKAAEAAGERHRVFCASLADVFELKDDQPELEEWRTMLYGLIDSTPHLDWLLLTKRPENVMKSLGYYWMCQIPENIWIGTSVEDQETADQRIPELMKIPAGVRFLSCEPLLGPVDLSNFQPFVQQKPKAWQRVEGILSGAIDWVIVGGESGPSARPMHPEWVRAIREECLDFEVPFFFKQWGEWVPSSHVTRFGIDARHFAWPWATKTSKGRDGDTTMMVKIGKKEAGRLIDGREWNEFPYPELDSHSSAE